MKHPADVPAESYDNNADTDAGEQAGASPAQKPAGRSFGPYYAKGGTQTHNKNKPAQGNVLTYIAK